MPRSPRAAIIRSSLRDGTFRYFTLGVRYEFNPQWSAAVELLYVPLNVRRPPEFALDQDSLTSVRVQLRCAID